MGKSDQIVTIPTIVTPRLILRAFGEEEIDRLHRILADKDVLHFGTDCYPYLMQSLAFARTRGAQAYDASAELGAL